MRLRTTNSAEMAQSPVRFHPSTSIRRNILTFESRVSILRQQFEVELEGVTKFEMRETRCWFRLTSTPDEIFSEVDARKIR